MVLLYHRACGGATHTAAGAAAYRLRGSMRGFYTTHEAAQVLGVSLPTVVNWIKARRLKAHRTPGGHRRIAREDLAGFMLRQGIPLPPGLSGRWTNAARRWSSDRSGRPARDSLASSPRPATMSSRRRPALRQGRPRPATNPTPWW